MKQIILYVAILTSINSYAQFNNEFYNKARRTTSGGAFTYMGSHGQGHEKGSCVTPPLSIYAMY